MSARANVSGVSDQLVDPDYIAPPGTPPAEGLELGAPDVGLPSDEKEAEKARAEREKVRAGENDGISGAEREKGGDPESQSPETTSSPDSKKREQTSKKTSSADATPSTAPSTTGRFSGPQKGNTTVSSGDTK